MATFDGIGADKADEILGMSVVSGVINGSGHLILTRYNGETIDAGDFTGIVTDVLDDVVAAEVAVVAANVPNLVAGTVETLGNISGALSLGSETPLELVNKMFRATMTGNVTFNSADIGSAPIIPNTQFAIRLQQDATGGRTLTLTGFKKSMGVLTLSTGANDIDIVVFLYDGTNWFAGMMGVDFA